MNVSIRYGKDEYNFPNSVLVINNALYKWYKINGFFFYPNEYAEFSFLKNNFIKCTDETIFKLIDVQHLESISNFDEFVEKQTQYHLYPSSIVAEAIVRSDENEKKLFIHAKQVIVKQLVMNPLVDEKFNNI